MKAIARSPQPAATGAHLRSRERVAAGEPSSSMRATDGVCPPMGRGKRVRGPGGMTMTGPQVGYAVYEVIEREPLAYPSTSTEGDPLPFASVAARPAK